MSLAITWIVIVNILVGGLAYFVLRALYREVVLPLLEERKKRQQNQKKHP